MNRSDVIDTIKRKIQIALDNTDNSCKKPWDLEQVYNWCGIKALDEIVEHSGAKIYFKKTECPIYALDEIDCPLRESFKTPFGYYGILFHELGHWTADRVNRELIHTKQGYAFEELVADFTSWILCLEYDVPEIVDNFYGRNVEEYWQDALKIRDWGMWEMFDEAIRLAYESAEYLKKTLC